MTSYFSNFFFNYEVGQLHALEGFITEQTRENAKYMHKTPRCPKRCCPTSKFQKIFFTSIWCVPESCLLFFIYCFNEAEIDLFFWNFGYFPYFCPPKKILVRILRGFWPKKDIYFDQQPCKILTKNFFGGQK